MDEYVLRTINLTKRFGQKNVVDHLNLNIKKGDIYGFIGPNGAGKTTAMKLVLSLLDPTSGEIELFGKRNNRQALRKVGSLIEAPGLYTNCTALENMRRFAILCGGTETEIIELLRMVGLGMVGNQKVKSFSLGMKQRLGIAIALLGHPELFVLDEPVNGLDPMGMRDVRDIILRINQQMGVTFFISSHLLGELEKISTVYGIIRQGVLSEEITAAELANMRKNSHAGSLGNIRVRCSRPEDAAELLRQNFGFMQIKIMGEVVDIQADISASAEINKALVLAGIDVMELGTNNIGYEDYFIQRMGIAPVQGRC